MASVTFELQVQGAGDAPLPVGLPGGGQVEIAGVGQAQVAFEVTNVLDRQVVIALASTVEGPAKDKLTVSFLSDVLTIPPGEVAVGNLTIEANEALTEADRATVKITGGEA